MSLQVALTSSHTVLGNERLFRRLGSAKTSGAGARPLMAREPSHEPLDSFLRGLVEDPDKSPHVCESRQAFVDELLFGQHVDRVAVLRGGLEMMDLADSMPRAFLDAARAHTSLFGFLDTLNSEVPLSSVDASLYYWDGKREKRLKRDASGARVRDLAAKSEAVRSEPDRYQDPLYLAEMRYTRKRKLESGSRSSTILKQDVKDKLQPSTSWLPMWDRGHAFVGGKGSGSSVHVDQILWSNVGKNWTGHKLLFVWQYGMETERILKLLHKRILRPPFTADDRAILASAHRVALVGPGDMFVFSGANAHMTLGVGHPLSLTAYESFVNLNARNVSVFCRSGKREHFEECVMDDTDLDDLKDDIIDNIYDSLKRLRKGRSPPSPSITSQVRKMVREVCRDRFYRRELTRMRKVHGVLRDILEDGFDRRRSRDKRRAGGSPPRERRTKRRRRDSGARRWGERRSSRG